MSRKPKGAIAKYAFGYSDDKKAAIRELTIVLIIAALVLLYNIV